MKVTSIDEMIYLYDVDEVETTEGYNGYPSKLKKAYIGWENFEDAKKCADDLGMQVQVFTRKDGHTLWYRTGHYADAPFVRNHENMNQGVNTWYPRTEEEYFQYCKERLSDGEFASLEEIADTASEMQRIYDRICDLAYDGDRVLIELEYNNYDVVHETCMDYEYDSTYYTIGII